MLERIDVAYVAAANRTHRSFNGLRGADVTSAGRCGQDQELVKFVHYRRDCDADRAGATVPTS